MAPRRQRSPPGQAREDARGQPLRPVSPTGTGSSRSRSETLEWQGAENSWPRLNRGAIARAGGGELALPTGGALAAVSPPQLGSLPVSEEGIGGGQAEERTPQCPPAGWPLGLLTTAPPPAAPAAGSPAAAPGGARPEPAPPAAAAGLGSCPQCLSGVPAGEVSPHAAPARQHSPPQQSPVAPQETCGPRWALGEPALPADGDPLVSGLQLLGIPRVGGWPPPVELLRQHAPAGTAAALAAPLPAQGDAEASRRPHSCRLYTDGSGGNSCGAQPAWAVLVVEADDHDQLALREAIAGRLQAEHLEGAPRAHWSALAECWAVLVALIWLAQRDADRDCFTLLLSDNRMTVQAIQAAERAPTLGPPLALAKSLFTALKTRMGDQLELHHIPGHGGEVWNEAADTAAGLAALGEWPLPAPLFPREWREDPRAKWLWLSAAPHAQRSQYPPARQEDVLAAGAHWPEEDAWGGASLCVPPPAAGFCPLPLRLGFCNVLTGGECSSSRPLIGRLRALGGQFSGEELDIVGTAELRLPEEGWRTVGGFRVLHSGSDRGRGGCGLWLCKHRRLLPDVPGSEPAALPVQVLHADPTRLIAVLDVVGCALACCVLHAPHSRTPEPALRSWWAQTLAVLREVRRSQQHCLLLLDANTTLGLPSTCSVGPCGAETDSRHAYLMRDLLDELDLVLPVTFVQPEPTLQATWAPPGRGDCTRRLDYIGVPREWLACVSDARACVAADVALGQLDHRLIRVDVAPSVCVAGPDTGSAAVARKPRRLRICTDKLADAQLADAFCAHLARFPAVPWHTSPSLHAASLESHLAEGLAMFAPDPPRRQGRDAPDPLQDCIALQRCVLEKLHVGIVSTRSLALRAFLLAWRAATARPLGRALAPLAASLVGWRADLRACLALVDTHSRQLSPRLWRWLLPPCLQGASAADVVRVLRTARDRLAASRDWLVRPLTQATKEEARRGANEQIRRAADAVRHAWELGDTQPVCASTRARAPLEEAWANASFACARGGRRTHRQSRRGC